MKEHKSQDLPNPYQVQTKTKQLRRTDSMRNLKGSVIHLQLNVSQLKKQVSSMSQLSSMIYQMQFQFTTQVYQLSETYEAVIYDLKTEKKKTQIILQNYQSSFQNQKARFAVELQKRDNLIERLLQKIEILQECHKYKSKDKLTHMNQQVEHLKTNNAELLQVIDRYKRHISQLQAKRKSLQYRENQGFVSLQKRNRFLIDRYLKQKKQNQSLKSHFSSLNKSKNKRFSTQYNLNNNYKSPIKIKNNPDTFRTECSPVSQHHKKSYSRQNYMVPSYNRKSIFLYTKNYNSPSSQKMKNKPTPSPQTKSTNIKNFQKYRQPTDLQSFLSSIRNL